MEMEKAEGNSIHLGFRASEALKRRVDVIAERMGQHLGGASISRSRVLQICVERHLESLEHMYRGA